jgi:hypothetical protein
MASVSDIREAMANALVLDGVQVHPYMLANPTPPTVHVYPDEITYDGAMARGVDTWVFKVQAYVAFVSDIGAQRRLDTWLAPSGSQSVKALLETDRTLGGLVHDLHVTDTTGYRLYSGPDGRTVLGAEWSVSVLASGT